ncbi:hypothetical protein Hanom_Chr12g01085611 [Helianthus anomalus]
MPVDQTCFQICHAPASLERHIICGMRPASTGYVLRAKPNKKGTRGHGMRPSSTRCVLQVSETSGEVSGELQVSDEFYGELLDIYLKDTSLS